MGYRESKEYSRKRIPFDLAYNIVSHLITGKVKKIIEQMKNV